MFATWRKVLALVAIYHMVQHFVQLMEGSGGTGSDLKQAVLDAVGSVYAEAQKIVKLPFTLTQVDDIAGRFVDAVVTVEHFLGHFIHGTNTPKATTSPATVSSTSTTA